MNLKNIGLVTKREYLTRVKKKTFILTTIFAPIAFIAFFAFMGYIMAKDSDKIKNIAVIDQANVFEGEISSVKNLKFTLSKLDTDQLEASYKNNEIDGYLIIPPIDSARIKSLDLEYHSDKQLGVDETFAISRKVRDKIRDYKMVKLELDEEKISALNTSVEINPIAIFEKDKKMTSLTNQVGLFLGMAIAYLMFFVILVYGSLVMRSVMEEKINRVVEVIISSVKPFDLMMGKILGVGSVGLTQITIWIILIGAGMTVMSVFFGIDAASANPMTDMVKDMPEAQAAVNENMDKFTGILTEVLNFNWALIIPLMIFYFFAGYFLYSAIFAAIGSAVGEDINEASSMTLPVMLPLLFGFYVAFSTISGMDKSLVVWCSIIPLTSPIVMPTRLPSDPAIWQILLSVILLVGFTIFFVWLAARIYRIGILMYGKKAGFKELGKWIFYKS